MNNSQDHLILDEETEQFEGAVNKRPDGMVEVILSKPIRADVRGRSGETQEKEFKTVIFRPLSFGDIKALANQDKENEMFVAHWLVHRLSDIPVLVFDKIAGKDMELCIEAISDFLPKSRKTSTPE